jgi:hypothetical protein
MTQQRSPRLQLQNPYVQAIAAEPAEHLDLALLHGQS